MAQQNKRTKKAVKKKKQMDQYDDLEYIDLDKGKKKRKKRRKRKGNKVLAFFIVLLLLLVAAYLGVAVFFHTHFMFQTKINGIDISLKNVQQVEEVMKDQVSGYELILEESDGTQEVIEGSAIGIEYSDEGQIANLAQGQDKFLWPMSLMEVQDIEAKVGVQYDNAKLDTVIGQLRCTQKENQKASRNAYPKFKDTQFVIVEEKIGTKIDEEVLRKVIAEAINEFQDRVNLADEHCYILPKYNSKSKEVIDATAKMNSFLGAKVTYEFGSEKEVVDAAKIAEWVKINKKKMKVRFDEDAVKEYIQTLSSKYDTRYKSKKFTTADGNTVTVEGGSYGFQINREKEYEQLTDDIKNAKVISREPAYVSRAASRDGAGVGSEYAEVDLTDQKMYYIKGGKVVLETGVVTGNPNKGNATPQGIYTVSYKTRNATLRGKKLPDGTYSYETPVAYWMPFNGGIGFHDATWQSSFGGDRYKSHGSHGCINMPKEKAAELYKLISAGIPVVCHY